MVHAVSHTHLFQVYSPKGSPHMGKARDSMAEGKIREGTHGRSQLTEAESLTVTKNLGLVSVHEVSDHKSRKGHS